MNLIFVVNGISVAIFGMLLSASFCDIIWTRKKNLFLIASAAAMLLLQGIVLIQFGSEAVRKLYPVITHIPMVLVIYFFSRRILWSVITVLMAYLCCQLRRWLSLLIVSLCFEIFPILELDTIELLITLPLFLFLLRFVSPSVRMISKYPASRQLQFGLIPVLSYGFDYLTRVYTDMLADGTPVVVEFMFFVCSAAYIMSVLQTSKEDWERSQLEQTQVYLNLQIAQAIREIGLMRESHQKARIYRHDLRHHLLFLSSCIENQKLEQAQTYIHEICSEMETGKVTVFCRNEAANLIFSTYAGQAETLGIPMEVKAEISRDIPISETDLCILLSNALENALHACQKMIEKGFPCKIEVISFEKNKKFFIQISNSCENDIVFSNGIPVTNRPGHGIGVRSICALVERYKGAYVFEVENGTFILRISI